MIRGDREAIALAATLGGHLRAARIGQHLRLIDVGRRVGLSLARLSELERGDGADTPLRTWVRLGIALGRPVAVGLTPPTGPERLEDAGHLEMQEWLLHLARRLAWAAAGWEVPTRPLEPRRSADVLVRVGRTLVLFECWNTIRDLGAAVRATNRKLAEARDLAVALGEAIRARFGASVAWARTLAGGGEPPDRLGFVWLDPRRGATTLRLRG